jgi:hypothetical protein
MAKLIGNAPNQISTNGDLGSMAFEDRTNYITKNNPVHQPYRNIIINGDMSIAQRGTSVSGITSAAAGTVHAVDRMALALSSAGTWTVSQETDVPSGQGFAKSLKFLCTTNEPSISAGGFITFMQKFEGQNLQYLKFGTSNAQSLTASFWIKSSKTGNFVVELADRDNSIYIAELVSINTANTWEKKTVTFQGNTANSFNNDNGNSLDLQLWFGTGTTYSSGTYSGVWQTSQSRRASGLDLQLQDTTNANVYLTGVQLEAGTTASDFEFLPYDVNLQRCQRYFYTEDNSDTYHALANGHINSATLFIGVIHLPVSLRSSPSFNTSGSFYVTSGGTDFTVSANSISDSTGTNLNTIQVRSTISGATAGNGAFLRNNNDSNAKFQLDAEL